MAVKNIPGPAPEPMGRGVLTSKEDAVLSKAEWGGGERVRAGMQKLRFEGVWGSAETAIGILTHHINQLRRRLHARLEPGIPGPPLALPVLPIAGHGLRVHSRLVTRPILDPLAQFVVMVAQPGEGEVDRVGEVLPRS